MSVAAHAARLAAEAGDELRFDALAEAAPVGIAVTEAGAGCVYANATLARVVGRAASSLLGSGWRDLLHPDDGEATAQMLLRYHQLGQEFHHRIRIVRPDGEERWVRVHGAPVPGAPAGRLVVVVDDATAEVEAELSLARRAAEYRQLVELSDGIIVRISPDGTVQYASPSCKTLLGWAPEDVVGRNAFDFVHPDDAAEAAAKFAESAAGRDAGSVRFRLLAADGSACWFDAAAQRRTRADGSLVDLVVNCRDQSERVAAEDALRRSEERYRGVVDRVREVIFQTDAAGRWTFLNAAWTVVSGFSVDETLGRRWIDFVHPDDRPVHRRIVHELFVRNRLHVRRELRGITKNGEPRWLEVAVQAVRDADGRVVGTTGTFNDVTARHEAEEELRRREARFRALVQNASDSITVLDEFGVFTYASPAAERLLGLEARAVVGQPAVEFIHPDDRDRVVEWYEAVVTSAVSPPLDYRIRHRDGTWRHVESVASNLVDDPGVRGVVVNTRDVTERKRAEDLVTGQTAVLEKIAEGRPLAEILDAIARLLENHVERTRCAIFRAELPGERLVIGAAPDLPMFAHQPGWAISGDGPVRRAVRDSTVTWAPELDPDGGDAPRRALRAAGLRSAWAVPVIDGAGTTVGAIALYGEEGWRPSDDAWRVMNLCTHLTRVAIERQEAADRLAHQALHDPLTGLANRALFLDRLAGALARAERHGSRVAVLFLDLDRFKVVNDSLGHDRGDLLLIALADRLRAVLRAEDTAARLGGDEFTVLCEDLASEDDARAIADRIAGALSEPFQLDERDVFVTASVGIAFARPHDRPEDLVRDADAAMYRAKELGKARSEIFDEAMRLRAVERLHTENALYHALERSELRLLFQPEVSLRTGEVVGVEALLRWDHPERGLIAPADFIPLAEETGLIVAIGAWALGEACRHAARWAETLGRKTPLTVWVNLSARQFADSDLPSIVADALAASGAPPRSVCLEITESVLMADVETTMNALAALHDLGVRLGIDDFGTGYSSLSYLQRFPVDFLKIDRSFVEGLGRAQESLAIVSGVVDLGHALGLGVIAEGVERPDQLEHLRRLGCDLAQGFLFAEPQTGPALEALLAARPVLP